MPRGLASREFQHLFRDGVTTGLTDKELLDWFTACRDRGGELAFAALVGRHGPMVRNVCRRMLRNPADADDAFQATFLVLVRKAGMVQEEVSVEDGWVRHSRGFFVAFRSAKGRPFAERKATLL